MHSNVSKPHPVTILSGTNPLNKFSQRVDNMNQVKTVLFVKFIATVSLLFVFSALLANPSDTEPQFIYVCNQGSASITIINSSTNEVEHVVELQEHGFSSNAKPHHAIAEADGSFWYVTLIGENRILKFNRANELVDEAILEVPGLLALHPTEQLLYVGRSMSAVNPPQSFGVIDRENMAVLDEVDLFFSRPHAITTTIDGEWTFVGSLSENQILSVNTGSDDSNLINIPGNTHTLVNFAVSPDGKTMAATGQVSGRLLIFDISDPGTPILSATITVGAQPWHPVFSPGGNYLYFGNKEDHSVAVVNMNERRLEQVITGEGLAQPHGAALSADGKYLYISNNNLDGTYNPGNNNSKEEFRGTVVIINTETRSIEKVIETGNYASGIGTNARF